MATAVVGAVIALLVAEALVVLSRDYVKDGGGRRTSGRFGDSDLPPLHLAVLGDSTAVGLGADFEDSYPWRLSQRLGEFFSVRLDVLGASGAKTSDVAESQLRRAIEMKPDLVLVAIGANDATHMTMIRNVRKHMGTVLDRLAEAGIDTVVAGPPHMGTSRAFPQPLRALSGINGKRVGAAIRKETLRRGLPFIDLSVTAPAFKDEPQKHYSPDMFHPGPRGYEVWADAMFPAVREAALKAAEKAKQPSPQR
ncbi:MAG: SGNH/GDSL hydrolase family protein [Actinomycetota bacterium]